MDRLCAIYSFTQSVVNLEATELVRHVGRFSSGWIGVPYQQRRGHFRRFHFFSEVFEYGADALYQQSVV